MQALVDTGFQPINFGPMTRAEEIMQNVRMICTTYRGTLPLDRDFGIDPDVVDLPMPRAKVAMEVDIVRQVGKYEPRAKVLQIIWQKDVDAIMDGQAQYQVLIDLPGVDA